jgi:16S rRNA (cytidine1402-2'-O)-methyltransferase
MLGDGACVAVVSDAGTPAISDPGARLVAAAAEAGATVTVVPGPSAVLAALVASGLPTERFCFEGFLPRRGALRRRRLEELAIEMRTAVVLEAPGRVADTVAELAATCGGERRVVVARELTKVHEELWRGTLAEAEAHFAANAVRGEVVIVLDGAPPAAEPDDALIVAALEKHLAQGDTLSDAARAVAQSFQVGHRRAYQLALGLPGHPPA